MVKMNMTRREMLAMLGVGASGLVLAGCGGGSSAPAGSAASAGSAEPAGSAAADASYDLVVPGKLTLVSEFYYPPFESFDKDNKPVGFDLDVYAGICDKLGLEQNILPNVKFDTILPMLKQGGKADVSLGCIVITDERKKEVDFSDPYMYSNQALVVTAGSTVADASELNNASSKVAVQAGTTSEAWARENVPDATIVPLDDVVQCLTGVQTGIYAGVLIDLPVAQYEITQSYSDLKIAQSIPTGEEIGVAVSKDNPNLTKAINQAIAELKDDGTIKELEVKWFGAEVD